MYHHQAVAIVQALLWIGHVIIAANESSASYGGPTDSRLHNQAEAIVKAALEKVDHDEKTGG